MAKELLLTSQSQNSKQISACFWDYNNGNVIHVYKNGNGVKAKTMNVIGNDYLLAAEPAKPLLHIWQLNSQDTLKNIRLVLPEPVSVLEVCPKGDFMAAGIGTKAYIWELGTGQLVSTQSLHYQSISSIRFSSGAECLVTAGEDGMVLCYQFIDLISSTSTHSQNRQVSCDVQPMYKRMDHSVAITDMRIEKFGMNSRFATASMDSTVRLYQLFDGQLLITIVYSTPLTAMALSCFNIYVGDMKGHIQCTSLASVPRGIDTYHVDDPPDAFIGHKDKIIGMELNIYNSLMASASEDSTIIIWELSSCQVLKRLEVKSVPTNLKFVLTSAQFFAPNKTPTKNICSIERTINNDETSSITWIQKNDHCIIDEVLELCKQQEEEVVEALQAQVEHMKQVNLNLLHQI